jgi:hypothetical protein
MAKVFVNPSYQTLYPKIFMNTSYNHLASQTSPYLLQHATNPVNWYPWGDEAFAKAKMENKLILISIGYSSCHWCHVMEKESFSNPEVAEFMNDHYVCIKVDREERPDVDQIYMNAIQIITRSGGWPLNCFTLPNGKPVFGGTYFKPEGWLDILKSLHFAWMTEPKKVIEVAEELTLGLSSTEIIAEKADSSPINPQILTNYVDNWSKRFDSRYGANKGAPKFAMPGSLQFLLDFAEVAQDEDVKKHVKLTLDKMQSGGIYDHLGGGFFRYSVDEQWYVPHFEKMLYDNAQLISLYSNAYKHFKDEQYRATVYQTIDFIRRELQSADGAFYSAIDADSEGEEGKFYTYSKEDIDNLLGPDAELFSIVYGATGSGVHLGKNVLRISASINETACLLGLSIDDVVERLKAARTKLFNARLTRIRPITDDKVILSWNALTIKALANAFVVFGDQRFLTDAIRTANFIENKLKSNDGTLQRIYCKGKTSIPAFLDDYAYLTQAYIALYQSTFDEVWLTKAKQLTDIAFDKFFDKQTDMFFLTSSEHDNIIVRKMEITDGVMPSSGAVMASNLITLSQYFRNDGYAEVATQMLQNIVEQLHRGGPYVYKWAHVFLKHIAGSAEIAFSGKEPKLKLLGLIRTLTYPHVTPYIYSQQSELPIANHPIDDGYFKLCIGNTCLPATANAEEVERRIKNERPFGSRH